MYSDEIYIVCPRCGGRAVVVPRPGLPELRYYSELQFRPRRLVCQNCGANREWVAERRNAALVGVALGGPNDPFFGLPLWLQRRCCGQLLWAYNARHLDALESYVGANLRERVGPTMGMLDRLPAWMKNAGSRGEVLHGINRLRAQLKRTMPEERLPEAHERSPQFGPRPVRHFYFRPPY